jgi:pyruvate dehydrogenase E2 component (dihydrolipoamide acetyltransferase)
MPKEITIPRLGWSMEEGVFVDWRKAPGEFVRAGDMVFELEGEKAAEEIESFDSGYLCVPSDAPSPGATVKVGQVIGFLLVEGEVPPTSVGKPPATSLANASPTPHVAASAQVATSAHVATSASVAITSVAITHALPVADAAIPRVAGPAARRLARELGIDLNSVYSPDPTGRILGEDVQRAAKSRRGSLQPEGSPAIATPRARRRAKALGVDWTQLPGTGRNGRIRERDVTSKPTAIEGNPAHSPELTPITPGPITSGTYTPASKLRQILAQRMQAVATQAAPVTLTTTVDAAPLMAYRARYKSLNQEGVVPSFNDILIGLAARTLRDVPELNTCWYQGGIYTYDAIHVATAVDTPLGLLAPVIRHADKLSIVQIAERTRQMIEQARAGRLNQSHLEGGTFTVSNLGMFGIDAFTPILNMPQAGILGIGRIVEAPVVRAGRLEIGHTLTLSLTFDHRVVDGAPAARWVQHYCKLLSQLATEHVPQPSDALPFA